MENYDKMKGEIYNVGLSNANLTKFELCKKIKSFIPDFVILEEKIKKDEDQRNYIVSNKKIENTGFVPEFSIEDGIQELIKGYKYLKKTGHSNV